MSQVITDLKWRYATKKFDSSKKISAEHIEILNEGLQLSASSYGLQLYKFFWIENPEVRAQLQPASWGQSQIVDASHLLVMAAKTEVTNEDIDGFIQLVSETRGAPLDALSGYGDFMKNAVVQGKSADEKIIWNSKQVYIALGNVMNLAANLEIDTTPMEGFDPAKYDEILGLADKGYTSAVVCAFGYRSEEDETAGAAKVRRPVSELVEVI